MNTINIGILDLPQKTNRFPKTWTHVYFHVGPVGSSRHYGKYRWLVQGGPARAKRLTPAIRDKLRSLGADMPDDVEVQVDYYSNTYLPEMRELVRRGHYTPFVPDEEA
jgi:plasmid stabilization system protein ParE